MKIKVLHLISSLDVGGAETSLYKLLSRMDRQRFDLHVACLIDIGQTGFRIQQLGIPVTALHMQRGRPSLAGFWRLAQLLRRERPHILQTWLYHADLLGIMAAQIVRAPQVVWNLRASNMDMSRYRWLSGWTVRACARLSGLPRAVITNSEAGRAFHMQIGYHPRHWRLIPNGVDTQQFVPDPMARESVRSELGIAADALLIGLVARFDPMKDHATFLRAAERLTQIDTSAHFLLVGEGVTADNPALVTLIASQALHQRVHFLGRRTDIPRLTAALDIATCSSVSEGFPNVVGEAMSCAVPCVVTAVGDARQIVGETGIVVPPREPQALATGWQQLIALGAEGRRKVGQAARKRIGHYYSLEKMTQQYQDFYLALI